MRYIIFFLIFLVSAISVFGSIGHQLISPNRYFTSSSTTINFSLNLNQTNNDATHFNITIYRKINNSGNNYSILFSRVINNGSFFQQTFALEDKTRYWWFANFTNLTGNISEVRLFDINTEIYKLTLGLTPVINFTLDSGNIYAAGNFTGEGCNTNQIDLTNQTITETCNTERMGMIRFNATKAMFYGCNGTGWNAL